MIENKNAGTVHQTVRVSEFDFLIRYFDHMRQGTSEIGENAS